MLTYLVIALLLGISAVAALLLIFGDDEARRSRERQEAIHRIVQDAEREMDQASSRHRDSLNELRRRQRRDDEH